MILQNTSPFAIPNIRLFIAFRVFFNARFYYPIFTILFLDYGLTIEQFSILNTVWAITIVCAEVPSGALADLLGRKRLLVLTSVLMIAEMSIIALVPVTDMTVVFWAFLINRVLSGLAEAMASGADEAIAYDSLIEQGSSDSWPQVLSVQMRISSLAGVISATLGALVYDPAIVNRVVSWFGLDGSLTQQDCMRYPVFLTLVLAFAALGAATRFQENQKRPGFEDEPVSLKTIGHAAMLTLHAGRWILKTPFALAIILFGMLYDHILRLIITLTSQYFRQIALPEASFGIIAGCFTMLGLFIPRLAELMVNRFRPVHNAAWLALLTLLTLLSLIPFIPYAGVLPMAMVMVGLLLTRFFTSHYLNRITPSNQRATVLSFKGLAYNLAYGIIGILFAALIAHLRQGLAVANPDWTDQLVGNEAFRQSFLWMPWYFLVLIGAIAFFSTRIMRKLKTEP